MSIDNFKIYLPRPNPKLKIYKFEIKLGGYQSGQMGRTVNPLLRLRRFESFSPHGIRLKEGITEGLNFILSLYNSIINHYKSGSSSVGRAIAFQAIGREFEPRLPLRIYLRATIDELRFVNRKSAIVN